MVKLLLTGFVWLGLLACGPTPEAETESEANDSLEPTLENIQKNLFSPRCSNAACHGGDNPVRELNLSDGKAYESLVNVESTIGQTHVIPGDPENSLLYQIIQESVNYIRQMPPGYEVEEADVAMVKAWIEAGAANN